MGHVKLNLLSQLCRVVSTNTGIRRLAFEKEKCKKSRGFIHKSAMQLQADHKYALQHLRSIVIYSLDHFNYSNAEFASERLLALDPHGLDSIYLYCLTLYNQERYKSCYNKSSNLADHLGCSFLYAKLCLKLKKYKEGIFQMLKVSYLYNENAEIAVLTELGQYKTNYMATPQERFDYERNRSTLPDLSSVYHLLGDLYKGMRDVKNSALNYSYALKYNQFDFEAFQELCKLGVEVKVKAIYNTNQSYRQERESSKAGAGMSNMSNPFSSYTPSADQKDNDVDFNNVSDVNATRFFEKGGKPLNTPKSSFLKVPEAPLRNSNTYDQFNRDDFTKPIIHTDPSNTSVAELGSRKSKRDHTYNKLASKLVPQPLNNKVETSQASIPSFNTLSIIPNSRGNLKRSNSNSNHLNNKVGHDRQGSTFSVMGAKEVEASDLFLRELYVIFAKGFKCFCKYNCYRSIRILDSLPLREKDTPWVLSKLGRLHYEIVNYKQSEHFFVKLRKLDRTRLEDMEYYSTLLWHLHKKVELTYLANELHDLDAKSPITWCTIGNLFSLNREPDDAIKCFNKAIRLDDSFTYGYTLKGHEYFGSDNYEMALENFRISLLIDSRHYNALYGIGMIYINLGDFQKADYHFRKALSINPINIILICCMGMVLEKIGKKSLALKQYELANKLQSLNPLPIFKKAQLLFAMQQYDSALEEFLVLRDLAPDEASIHFLMGQLYNIRNDKFQAIREFTIALNLDPKGNYLVRESMESLKDK